jgi:hypothetical protein
MGKPAEPYDELVKTRLRLIELIAWWEGGVNATHLTDVFRIGRQQASKMFRLYQSAWPDNLLYDNRARLYRPAPAFAAQFISLDVHEYLDCLERGLHLLDWAPGLPLENLQIPQRNVPPQLIQPLVQALKTGQRLDVEYVSLSRPDLEGRVIVPVRFVKTGLRWHVRAWCEKNRDYRDFVLGRFRGIPVLEGQPDTPLPVDNAWETIIHLIIRPDTRLSPLQQETLSADYGMENGELHLYPRATLARYLLNEMQVSFKVLDGNPAAQQLVLANYNDVKQWLY